MPIKIVDEAALETDVDYRFRYVRDFVGLTQADVDTIREASQEMRERLPQLADALLIKLMESEGTMQFFAPIADGRNQKSSARSQKLSLDHPRVAAIRRNLVEFLEELVSGEYDDASFARKLDAIGAIHANPDRADAKVPIFRINAMMGFLSDRLMAKARSLGLPHDREIALVTSLQKVIWIQMNMTTRHYVR